MNSEWPFDQPPNCAVITLRQVISGTEPILLVVHDANDHGWQFLTLDDASEEDASIVGLGEVTRLDPTVLQVAHIAPGWRAWRRSVDDEWVVEECG